MFQKKSIKNLFSNKISEEVKAKKNDNVVLRSPTPSFFGLARGGAVASLSMPRHYTENMQSGSQCMGNEPIFREKLTTVTPLLLPDEGHLYRVRFCHMPTSHALSFIPALLGHVVGVQHCGVLIEGFKINQNGTVISEKPAIVAVYGFNNNISKNKRNELKNRIEQDLRGLQKGKREDQSQFLDILKNQLKYAAGLDLDLKDGSLRGISGIGFMNEACSDFLGTDSFFALKEDKFRVKSLMPLAAVKKGFDEMIFSCAINPLNHAHRNCGTVAILCIHEMYANAYASGLINPALQELHQKQINFAKRVNHGIGVTRNKYVVDAEHHSTTLQSKL